MLHNLTDNYNITYLESAITNAKAQRQEEINIKNKMEYYTNEYRKLIDLQKSSNYEAMKTQQDLIEQLRGRLGLTKEQLDTCEKTADTERDFDKNIEKAQEMKGNDAKQYWEGNG